MQANLIHEIVGIFFLFFVSTTLRLLLFTIQKKSHMQKQRRAL